MVCCSCLLCSSCFWRVIGPIFGSGVGISGVIGFAEEREEVLLFGVLVYRKWVLFSLFGCSCSSTCCFSCARVNA